MLINPVLHKSMFYAIIQTLTHCRPINSGLT